MRLFFLFLVGCTLLSSVVSANERTKIIEAVVSGVQVIDSSTGAINGTVHLAAIVSKGDDFSLVVLERSDDGGYKIRSQSGWWSSHLRWYDTSIKVKNNSVYFSIKGNGGCCSDYFSQYQFKPIDGAFTLVGTEDSVIGTEQKVDIQDTKIEGRPISYMYGTSINYLSGDVLHWRVQAPSTSDTPYKNDFLRIKSGKKRAEKRSRFVPTRSTLLQRFDIWADSDKQEGKTYGYFDQRLKFREVEVSGSSKP